MPPQAQLMQLLAGPATPFDLWNPYNMRQPWLDMHLVVDIDSRM